MNQFELLDESPNDNAKWVAQVGRGAVFFPRIFQICAVATVALGAAFYMGLSIQNLPNKDTYLTILFLSFLGMAIATGITFFFKEQNKREITLLNSEYVPTNANLWIWLIGTLMAIMAVMWGAENARSFGISEEIAFIIICIFWCAGVYLAIQFALFLDTRLKQIVKLGKQIRFLSWVLIGLVVLALLAFLALGAADEANIVRGDHIIAAIMGIALMGTAMFASVIVLLIQCNLRKKFL